MARRGGRYSICARRMLRSSAGDILSGMSASRPRPTQGLIPRVFLEYVERPQQVGHLGDDVRLPLPAPRALSRSMKSPPGLNPTEANPTRCCSDPEA